MDLENIFLQGNPTAHLDGPCPLVMAWLGSGDPAHEAVGSHATEVERVPGDRPMKHIDDNPTPHHHGTAPGEHGGAQENMRSGSHVPLSHSNLH
jgi:hypothetical protein